MNEQTKTADTVTITAAKYKNMIDKDDFCITAERLESAIMLLYDWVFFGRNDAIAETPILWLPHAKSLLIGKDPDAGRDWGQEEKGR